MTSYAVRAQTRREQLDALRAEFDFRMYAPGHGRELLAWLLPIDLATTNASAVAAALMDSFAYAGSSRVDRLSSNAWSPRC